MKAKTQITFIAIAAAYFLVNVIFRMQAIDEKTNLKTSI